MRNPKQDLMQSTRGGPSVAIDLLRVTQILKRALLRDLGDEVDIIFRYGSCLSDSTHQYSDVDISYVPVHETTWNSITVLVDEVMVDLYPIHWSRLERMASFDDVSCTVLLRNEIVHQRSDSVAMRFRQLPDHLRALQDPDARSLMLTKAQSIFEESGYQYYLLSQQVAAGHTLSCLHHVRNIRDTVLHCVMVCNQACIDTRQLDQVLSLTKLPERFAETLDRITNAWEPSEIMLACEELLSTTRDLLVQEQRRDQCDEASFPEVFEAAYPELKGDLQHLVLACERRDSFNHTLMSLYHELMVHIARAMSGIEYSGFNTLAEYEQDLSAMGFPELLPYLASGDFDRLRRQCELFDQRLREFLIDHSVSLNEFSTLDELETHLALEGKEGR